jgi:hypothetical protein
MPQPRPLQMRKRCLARPIFVQSHRQSRWLFVLRRIDIRRCTGVRRAPSGRKRRLANLRRRLLLPGFGAGGSGQLQHGGTLAHTQTREQHHLPVRELKRIVMGHDVIHVDLPEAREPLFNFLVRENADAE